MSGVRWSLGKLIEAATETVSEGISNLFSFDQKKEAYTSLFQLHEGAKDALENFTKSITSVPDADKSPLSSVFYSAATDSAITIPTASATITAKQSEIKADAKDKSGFLGEKDIYTSVKAAALDDDLRNEGIYLEAYGNDGKTKAYEDYTDADWHNIAMSLTAAEENGLHVKNAVDINKALKDRPELSAVTHSASAQWNDFKKAEHDVKPAKKGLFGKTKPPEAGYNFSGAKAILDKINIGKSVASTRQQIDMPVGRTLEEYDIVSPNAFKLKGELQAELFAIRMAHAEGKTKLESDTPKKRKWWDRSRDDTKKPTSPNLFALLDAAKKDADDKGLEGDDRIIAMRDFIAAEGDKIVEDKTALTQYREFGADVVKGGFKYGGTGANSYDLGDGKKYDFPDKSTGKNIAAPPIGVIAKATDGAGFYDAMTALQLTTSRGGFDGIGRLQSGTPDTETAEKYNALNFQREPFADEPEEIRALWSISKKVNEAEKDGAELSLTPDEKDTLAYGFEYALYTLEEEAKHASPEMAENIASLTHDVETVAVYYAQKFGLSKLEADLTADAKPEPGP